MHTPSKPTRVQEAQKPEEDASIESIEILEIEDDLDTGMHRVNVCQSFA